MRERRFAFGLAMPAGAAVLLAGLWFAVPAWSSPRHDADWGGVSIVSVSNLHPDLVSGGEVLLRVSTSPGARGGRVRITLNSADVSSDFVAQPDGTLLGLVTGLRDGVNVVRAADIDRWDAARLVVVNHPITGPVFSGPQQLPFYCQTTASAWHRRRCRTAQPRRRFPMSTCPLLAPTSRGRPPEPRRRRTRRIWR